MFGLCFIKERKADMTNELQLKCKAATVNVGAQM